MNKKNFLLLSLLSMTTIHNSFSMEKPTTKVKSIKFKGEETPLLNLILASQLNPTHPFSVTRIIDKTNNGYVQKGDILNLNEEDLGKLGKGEYEYVSYYTLEKTRLSQGQYVEVGAIIFGTQNEDGTTNEPCKEDAKDLHFASLRAMMKQFRTQQEDYDNDTE